MRLRFFIIESIITIRFLTKQTLAPFSTALHADTFAFDMTNQKARILEWLQVDYASAKMNC